MSNVAIKDLVIRLGGNDIISKLNLDIAEGEFLVLLGPSGCGKSTLLHSIAGLIDVHAGHMEIGGNDVTWADPKDRGIGMVFQSYALYPTMTVEKNMAFGPRIAGVEKAKIERRVARAAKMLHLNELLQRKPSQLSGGQRQRVAIGRALVREADVFLFDEPLSNLDAKLRSELRKELKQLHRELGATMIYVTHDQVEAMTLATRIAVMKAGKIQQIDTPSAVYNRPTNLFVAGFLGAPSMNLFTGRIAVEGGKPWFAGEIVRADLSSYAFKVPPQSGQSVIMGVRPEHITLVADGAAASGRATIALIEPMGANQVVWLDAKGMSMSVDVDSHVELAIDLEVGFALSPGQLSLFDADTQQRL